MASFLCVIPGGLLGAEESLVAVSMAKSLELSHHDKRYPDWNPGQNMRVVMMNGATTDLTMIGSADLSDMTDYGYRSSHSLDDRDERKRNGFSDLPSPEDDRFHRLACRVLFGCCAEFDTRTGVVVGPRPKREPPKRGRESALPTEWIVKLTRDVEVDCTESVRSYLQGHRGSLKTQHLRRGHWRNQPHGPKSSLRKFIHIEPKWIGPNGAPIAVRAHRLNDLPSGEPQGSVVSAEDQTDARDRGE